MTRKEIERELFKDLCASSYPRAGREAATRYIQECKPIAEANNRREATRLYDEVLLRYAKDLPA